MGIDLSHIGSQIGPIRTTYNWRDVALYAIGLGAGQEDIDYLLDDPPPKVLPTFGVVTAFAPVFQALKRTGGNLVTLLHSGQRTELVAPFPSDGEMQTTARIDGIWDMKIGAFAAISTTTEVNDVLTAKTTWQLLLRGEGGFGGARPPKLLRTKPEKDQSPDFVVEVPTAPNQALLYRLNGDINPIHAKPEVAQAAGFDRPILHGLCSYGIAARIALKELAGNDPGRFKVFEARFAKVVMPGDTLIVAGYLLESPGQAAITVTVEQTGEQAIANAHFEFKP
ncbi:MAG: MaoC/PaaZ C-terminal domain-containing protein [Myxococcota bacterium]|nr:MaoC/PaaZ C-terminal domain-containing protein [Myxococcota bacterium]